MQADTPGRVLPNELEEEVCVGLMPMWNGSANLQWKTKKEWARWHGMKGDGNFQRSTLKV